MGDGDVGASIKRTQDQLGKFVKKPPLTDKNLTRPPFRFLHDIVHNVIDSTGFMAGVFTPEELDAANVSSREAKSAFMQKLIQAIKDKTGEEVPVKVSKVLAGLEADKTNGLLQSLARAIESHQQDSGSPPKKGGAAAAGSKKPAAAAGASKSKAGAASKPDSKKPGAAGKGTTDKKDGGSGGTKRTIRDPSPGGSGGTGGRTGAKQGKTNEGGGSGSGSKSKSRALKPTATVEPTPPASLEPSVPESLVNDETNETELPAANPVPSTSTKSLARKESSADMLGSKNKVNDNDENVDLDNNDFVGRATSSIPSGANNSSSNNDDDVNNGNANLGLYDNNYVAAASPSLGKSNMQTLPPPTTPILTDADAVNATMTPPPGEMPLTPTHKSSSLTPTPGPSLTPSPIGGIGGSRRPPSGAQGSGRSLSREASAEQQGKGSPYGSASIGEIRPPTGQQQVRSRPDTGTSGRLSSARPPSARRAPPRPKSSVVREEVEPYRPTTGKVAHVIMDDTEEPDDDDNYVVREVTVTAASKPPGLSDLDETPELGIMGGGGLGGMGGELDSILPPDQRGLLVNQILETQKELEEKGKGGGEETPMIEKKLKELSVQEIDKLKNFIQMCARSANPLAKLLDYMAEDVDSMQKEYNAYREESKRLSLELENARGDTDKFLQSLKNEVNDIERKIKDKEDAILASQMKIIQQEERIEEIVAGFERVRSGKSSQGAKEHMPSAEEILAHIQGQSTLAGGGGVGGGGGYGGGGVGGPPSAFTFSSVGPSIGSTPNSAASGPIAAAEPFKIPDSFMVSPNSAGGGGGGRIGETTSPFSRGRMWSSMANNNNGGGGNATFDIMNSMDEDDDQIGSIGMGVGARMGRNTGRSGGIGVGGGVGGVGGGGGFRRSASTMDYPMEASAGLGGGNRMDTEFNPW